MGLFLRVLPLLFNFNLFYSSQVNPSQQHFAKQFCLCAEQWDASGIGGPRRDSRWELFSLYQACQWNHLVQDQSPCCLAQTLQAAPSIYPVSSSGCSIHRASFPRFIITVTQCSVLGAWLNRDSNSSPCSQNPAFIPQTRSQDQFPLLAQFNSKPFSGLIMWSCLILSERSINKPIQDLLRLAAALWGLSQRSFTSFTTCSF